MVKHVRSRRASGLLFGAPAPAVRPPREVHTAEIEVFATEPTTDGTLVSTG